MKTIDEYDYLSCSYHSIQRATERLGITAQKAQKLIKKALIRGKTYEEYSGKERSYLMSKSVGGTRVVTYAGYIYIYTEGGLCLTTFKLPDWFGKREFFSQKEQVRNVKKFSKHYGSYFERNPAY